VALSKETDTVMVHPETTTQVTLPKGLDLEKDLVYTIDLPEQVDAPVTAGQVLGSVTVSYNGQEYAKVPLLALSDVSASTFLTWKEIVLEFLSRTIVKAAIAAVLILILALWIWLKFFRSRRRYGRGGKRYRPAKYRGRKRN
jgi:D-alanyl-D-alanine carboxypeptidase (penicillin-binding protein 5/6)